MGMTTQLDYDAHESMNEGRGLCRVLAIGVLLAVATVAGCVFTGCALLDTVASDERVQAEFDRAVERIRLALADIVFYQVSPGRSASWIKAETKRVVALVNKPVNFFELSRHEDRTLSKAALDGGAYGVANW